MTPLFYDGWSSWTVELVAGTGLGIVAVALTHHMIAAAACAVLASAFYERWLDRNGWSWSDVGQRALGIVIGLFLGGLLYG